MNTKTLFVPMFAHSLVLQVLMTTLLKVYVRGRLFEKARELLTELEVLGYAEEEMPYCLLMDALSKARKIDEAKLVFSEMKIKYVKTGMYLLETK
ncbi:pentatricopeptide repeat (PPR) superfamily protein [Artemisia annua]|uniref:Pentatricopeptide repeat (PPR) superfamily protein n=1 Tax=Artemisia annua TaxID=35608 RepID=A0A2U1LFN0_ARTAN|nr:pentatricopeptide repeat (PPR) superfamily protein [Artemisia annua]